ncbi:MAG: DotU family type IV/VI secretion system protein [Gemmatimonadales bacterium]|nr:MAG: DotU family type IV/VI secretion system protein [Gemmatimonadales bacterium]
MASPPPGTQGGTAAAGGAGELALHMQELLTVIARIRSDRQVADDVDAFRDHVKRLMARSDREARESGYGDETVRYALYAVVAFLDESVLNSPRELFSSWPGRPLQEEIFGDHMAGETFYAYLDSLLDSSAGPERADLLEVYLLCLLMGFRGRYGSADSGERSRRIRRTRETIDGVRGEQGAMAPRWGVPEDEGAVPRHSDPWVPRLAAAALVSVLLTGGLWLVFRALLPGGLA